MSVFRSIDWWYATIARDEEFSLGCVVVGNIDNMQPPSDKIVVGSNNGILRIYKPAQPQYRVEDLMLEEMFNLPILQVLLGHFIPNNTIKFAVAILHPRVLTVYEIIPQMDKETEKEKVYYTLNKHYTHQLGFEHFSAYNAISGRFGGSKQDMILVQSLDGKIEIFDAAAQTLIYQFYDSLLPCPLLYLLQNDSFVAANNSNHIDCYRYHVLATAQMNNTNVNVATVSSLNNDSNNNNNSTNAVKTRAASAEWSLNLGDACVQLLYGHFRPESSQTGGDILVLCEYSINLIKLNGSLQQQRKIASGALCVTSYTPDLQKKNQIQNFIIAYRHSLIQIYSSFQLIWACQMEVSPVDILVGNFNACDGMIVTLSDSGKLAVSYLGTRPVVAALAPTSREMDPQAMAQEQKELSRIIKESQMGLKASSESHILIQTQVSTTFDVLPLSIDIPENMKLQMLPMITRLDRDQMKSSSSIYAKIFVRVKLSTDREEEIEASVTISTPESVYAYPKIVQGVKLVPGRKVAPVELKFCLYAINTILPSDLIGSIQAQFTSPSTSTPFVHSQSFNIPLFLLSQPTIPTKNGRFKLTLETLSTGSETNSLPAVPLTQLFHDYINAYLDIGVSINDSTGDSFAKAMGFLLWPTTAITFTSENVQSNEAKTSDIVPSKDDGHSPTVVSIIASKNGGKYRVHSDSIAALYVVTQELQARLHVHFNSEKLKESKENESRSDSDNQKVNVICQDSLPLDPYFDLISKNYKKRLQFDEYMSKLNNQAHQYRMIQKRLLVKYKDKNPSSLASLDILLNETYQEILQTSDRLEKAQNERLFMQYSINNVSKLIVLILLMKHQLPQQEKDKLNDLFCPSTSASNDQGWEELVDASMTYLLKTSLAKKPQTTTTLTSLDERVPLEMLLKHISQVVERVGVTRSS